MYDRHGLVVNMINIDVCSHKNGSYTVVHRRLKILLLVITNLTRRTYFSSGEVAVGTSAQASCLLTQRSGHKSQSRQIADGSKRVDKVKLKIFLLS